MPYFFTKSLSLPCINEGQLSTYLVGTMSCPAHVDNFSLRLSHTLQYQTLYRELHPSVLQIGWNMRVVDRSCRVEVLTLPEQILWWLPQSSSKPVGSLAEARFLLDSCEAEVVLSASEFCQRPDVDLGIDCLPPRHCIHKNHVFTVPERVIMTLPAERDLLFFFSEGIEDSAFPWIAFLYPVQNNGPICCNNPG